MHIAWLQVIAFALAISTAAGTAGLAQDMSEEEKAATGQDSSDADGSDEDETVPPNCVRMFGQTMCREREEAIAQRLVRQGPIETTHNDGTNFSAQGFVRGGWPVAVDFEPQPNSQTYLNIALYDPDAPYFSSGEPIRITIDQDGQTGRRVFQSDHLELPGLAEQGPIRIATFFVTSVQLRDDGRPSRRASPVRVFGIGVGPSAVEALDIEEFEEEKPIKAAGLRLPFGIEPDGNEGFRSALLLTHSRASPLPLSLAGFMQPLGTGRMSLTDIMLGDGTDRLALPSSGRVSIPYGFVLRRPFDLVRSELLRDCRRIFCNGLAASSEVRRYRGPLHGQAPVRRTGTYWLSVRAWLICETPDFRQCADGAAWTTGRAGPLLVES